MSEKQNTSDEAALQDLQRAIDAAVRAVEPMLNTQEVKIYDLADAVSQAISFEWHCDAYVALYQKLYITQAALCRVSQKLDENTESGASWVELSPVGAKLRHIHPGAKAGGAISNESTRPNDAFFLDPKNFFGITADDVQNLLTQFWTRYELISRKDDALFILGLSGKPLDTLTWHEIQSAYRKKAAQHHPDKGGDPAAFIEIRLAYDQLKPLFTS